MLKEKDFDREAGVWRDGTGFAYCPKCQIMDEVDIPLHQSKYGYTCKVCDTTYMTEDGAQLALEDAVSAVSYA